MPSSALELFVQCEAVNTCRSEISVPPHQVELLPGLTRLTCHGIEWGVTSDPPTILEGLPPQPTRD